MAQPHYLLAALVLATLMAPLIAFSPPSQLKITTSQLNSSPSDLSSNVEELELLRKERRNQLGEHKTEREEEERDTKHCHIQPTSTKQETQQSSNQKNSIKTILSIPVGDLTQRDLTGLCNSIRYVPEEKSLWSLRILERILTEVERWEDAQRFDKRTFVKKIHIFSVLTALTKSSQSRKSQRRQYSARKSKKKNQQYLDSKDMARLQNVVFLLKELCRDKRTPYCDADCYQKDVLSFATMIAADSSMIEASAADVALKFIDELEKEIDGWDARVVGSVLNALAQWGRAEEAHALLSRAMGFEIAMAASDASNESVKSSGINSLNPADATPCYDSLLRAYAKCALLLADKKKSKRPSKNSSSNTRNASATEALARARYILLNHMPAEGMQITNHTCNAVLSGYAALGMGTEAEKLLQEIETLLSQSSSQLSALDTACYNSVLHGFSRERNGVSSAERLFKAMAEQNSLHKATSSITILPPLPDTITYASMLNCYSINRMGEEAYSLVQQIERPTSACYLSAIRALERSNDTTSPDRVLSLIDQIEQSGSGKGPSTALNRRLFNAAMQCMIKRGEGAKAEDVLEKYLNCNLSPAKNDIELYVLALKAYENTKPAYKRKEAAESAEALFHKMQSMDNVPQLDAGTYNILLNCFARAGMSSAAEKLLEEFTPTPESYGLVIKAISLSDDKDAVERAWNILYQIGYPRENVKDVEPFSVPITTFNSMLKLFARRGMATEAEALLHSIDEYILEGKSKESGPNIRSYEAVLEAIGKTSDLDAVERAESLVTRVEVMSELGGGIQQPTLKLYNTLLACYANAGKVGSAERLLSRLHDQSLKPDAYSYGATIKALKNSGKSKDIAIARAKELAQSLEQNGGGGNEIIFAHRLSILAKFGLAQQAENLLKEMDHKHKLGDLKQGPGIIHYTAILNAWAKTDDNKAIPRAEALFEKMKDDPSLDLDLAAYHGLLLNYAVRGMSKKARRLLQVILDSDTLSPNRNTFTMVIDSYSRSSSNANAGLKAEELLDQMRELQAAGNSEVEPDSVCYASVIRAKQASQPSSGTINDLSDFDKVQLMRELQIETWPFQ
ncbi:hypothetical protein ACHAWT_004626 [Skeletonema menzelii]